MTISTHTEQHLSELRSSRADVPHNFHFYPNRVLSRLEVSVGYLPTFLPSD